MTDTLHHLEDEQGELNDSVAGLLLDGRLRRDEAVAHRGLELQPVLDRSAVLGVFVPGAAENEAVELLNVRAIPTASALVDRLDDLADRQAPSATPEADTA